MVSRANKPDLEKIKRLIATATNARQKAMYEKLLQKAEKQLTAEKAQKAKIEAKAVSKNSSKVATKSAKKSQKKSQEKKSNNSVSSQQTGVDPKAVKVSPLIPEEESTKSNSKSNQSPRTVIFQGIGVIEGLVEIDETERLTITVEGQKYRLGYTPISKKRSYQALVKEIKSHGSRVKKIAVYPQCYHRENQSNHLNFNLVSVEKEGEKGIFKELNGGEFFLSGFYQYIPRCSLPCITVLRNHSEGLAQKVQRIGNNKASQLLKPNHVPVEWFEAPIEAFKYNSEIEKSEQMPRWFVELKASWDSEEKKFRVIELKGEASKKAPRYLKQ